MSMQILGELDVSFLLEKSYPTWLVSKKRADVVTTFPTSSVISDLHHYDCKRLLLTLSTTPELHLLASNTIEDPNSYTLLHRFDSEKARHSLAKLDTYTYVVLTSQSIWKPEAQDCEMKRGTSAIWKLDLSRWVATTGGVEVEKLTDFPNAGHLNKMTTLPMRVSNDAAKVWPQCLITDSIVGTIILFDPNTKASSTWLSHPTMAPAPLEDPIWRTIKESAKSGRTPLTDAFGITGIAYFEGYVYFINSHDSRLWRIKVDPETLQALPNAPLNNCELVVRTVSHILHCPGHCTDLAIVKHKPHKGPVAYMTAEKGIFGTQIEGKRRFRQFHRELSHAFKGATCLAIGEGEGGVMGLNRFKSGTHLWVGTRGTRGTEQSQTGLGWESGEWQEFWTGGRVLRQWLYIPDAT